MRAEVRVVLLGLLLSGPIVEARPWRNDAGQVIEAEAIELRGDSVVLSKDGKEFVVPISKLSADDREFLKTWKPPVAAPKTLTFAGKPLETGGKINTYEFDYSPAVLKALKTRYRSEETKFKISIVAPANFDPSKPQHVFMPSSAVNNPEEAKAGNAKVIPNYAQTCLNNGWLCLTTDSDLGITDNFVALESGIEELDRQWPGFKRWSFATGGFSGGGKGCHYIAAQLIKTNHKVIGVFIGASNEDWSAKCRDYLKAPVSGYRSVNAFLSVGKNDTLATPAVCAEMEKSLHANGLPSTRLELFDGGHTLHKPHIDAALKWFVEKEGGK